MGTEIERKFLVKGSGYKSLATNKKEIAQGYLSINPDSTVRVRIADEQGFITIKSRNHGAVRGEWEYPIPVNDAKELLNELCAGMSIIKTRYIVPFNGLIWEIDVFHGHLEGLIVAEVELPSVDTPVEPLPDFIGKEVTGDCRYYNSNLIKPEGFIVG